MNPSQCTLRWLPACLSLLCLVGCGPHIGWWSANLASQTVEAQHNLDEDQPLLVLVVDPVGDLEREQIKTELTHRLVVLLRENQAAGQIIDPKYAIRLRQTRPEYNEMSPEEIARRLQAKQLMLVEIKHVISPDNIQGEKPQIAANVRVKDPATGRDIWPDMAGAGYDIAPVSLGPSKSRQLTRAAEIRTELVNRLADDISKLFYDHKADRI